MSSPSVAQSPGELTGEFLGFTEEAFELSTDEGGGFYAAELGSNLNSRYTVIGKLGWGIYSSVWLARDTSKQPHASQRYVAVKILCAHATEIQGTQANELEHLQLINTRMKADPSFKHVATLLDSFTITDHHGPHLCLVFEPLGIFRGSLFNSGKGMPVPLVKEVARQLLVALDFLHRECGIVHTDLKPDNILLALPNPEEALQRYIDEVSKSEAGPLMPGSSIPVVLSHPVFPFTLDELQDSDRIQSKLDIRLVDFGTAAMVEGPHADLIQPYALRAPEVLLGTGWDTSADIWSLGCLVFEFLTGKWLVTPQDGPNYSREGYHLGLLPTLTGDEFDLEYVRKGEHYDELFTPEGNLFVRISNPKTLEQILDIYHVLDDVEKPLCLDFLRSMFRLKPSDRASASELLRHPWLRS